LEREGQPKRVIKGRFPPYFPFKKGGVSQILGNLYLEGKIVRGFLEFILWPELGLAQVNYFSPEIKVFLIPLKGVEAGLNNFWRGRN